MDLNLDIEVSICQLLNQPNWSFCLTSSRMCHPSCQSEPGNGRPPHRWRLLRRWATDSCDPRPPASSRCQSRTWHPPKERQQTGSRCSAAVGLQHVSERDWKITPGMDVWYISVQLKTFIRNIKLLVWRFNFPAIFIQGAGVAYIIYGDSYPPRTGKEFFGSPLCFSHSQVIGPGKLFLFAACKRKKVYAEKQTRCVIFGIIAQHVLIAWLGSTYRWKTKAVYKNRIGLSLFS